MMISVTEWLFKTLKCFQPFLLHFKKTGKFIFLGLWWRLSCYMYTHLLDMCGMPQMSAMSFWWSQHSIYFFLRGRADESEKALLWGQFLGSELWKGSRCQKSPMVTKALIVWLQSCSFRIHLQNLPLATCGGSDLVMGKHTRCLHWRPEDPTDRASQGLFDYVPCFAHCWQRLFRKHAEYNRLIMCGSLN